MEAKTVTSLQRLAARTILTSEAEELVQIEKSVTMFLNNQAGIEVVFSPDSESLQAFYLRLVDRWSGPDRLVSSQIDFPQWFEKLTSILSSLQELTSTSVGISDPKERYLFWINNGDLQSFGTHPSIWSRTSDLFIDLDSDDFRVRHEINYKDTEIVKGMFLWLSYKTKYFTEKHKMISRSCSVLPTGGLGEWMPWYFFHREAISEWFRSDKIPSASHMRDTLGLADPWPTGPPRWSLA